MKIAMLNCLRANECCTGAACLRAMNSRTRHFAGYAGTELELTAMARCNGCGAGLDRGFVEKLDRIVSEGTQVVHLGVCTGSDGRECGTISRAAEYLELRGVKIVRGTH